MTGMTHELQEEPVRSENTSLQDDPDCHVAHLWTPWRMAYVAEGGSREAGCIFCNRLLSNKDVENLLLYRGDLVFSIMNLYPYNTGHVMIVPNRHVPSPEEIDAETLTAGSLLMQESLRALRTALSCEGFNIGLNVGTPAGAGVAEHMHQHIVPRWTGDANFMPILGGTMVMPELLPVTYAKVRAELYRGAGEPAAVGICCFDSTGQRIAVHAGDKSVSLPSFQPVNGEPIWRTGYQFLESAGVNAQLTGWGGSEQASSGKRSGLAFVATGEGGTPRGLRFIDVDLAFQQFSDGAESAMVRRAFERSFATSSQHPQRVS